MASASRYLSIPLPNGSRISLLLSLPFALVHIAALLIFFFPFHWYYLVTCLVLLIVRMFFVTAGYHRYFSHRSFKTSRVFQFVIAFMAMTSSQKGVLWWAAHHRHQDRKSTRLNSSHANISYAVFCLNKKNQVWLRTPITKAPTERSILTCRGMKRSS